MRIFRVILSYALLLFCTQAIGTRIASATIEPTCADSGLKILPPVTAGDSATVTICADPAATSVSVFVDGQKSADANRVGEYVTKALDLTSVKALQVVQTVGAKIQPSIPILLLPAKSSSKPSAAKETESPSCASKSTSELPAILGSPPPSKQVTVVICADPSASNVDLIDFSQGNAGTALDSLKKPAGVFLAITKVAANQKVQAAQTVGGKQTLSDVVTATKAQASNAGNGEPEGKILYTRMIAGTDISGASSADTKQTYYLEVGITAPLLPNFKRAEESPAPDGDASRRCPKTPENCRMWVWANPRITDLTSPTNAAGSEGVLSSLTAFPGGTSASSNLNQIVHGFEFLAGFDTKLFNGPRFGDTIISFEWTASAGVITPFSVDKTAQIFLVNSTLQTNYPDVKTSCSVTSNGTTTTGQPCAYIAFVSPDRDRFFHQYYTGLRIKSFYQKKDCTPDETMDCGPRFPGTFDITVGKNDAVSRWVKPGPVLRIEGFYPIYKGVYVYATVFTHFKGKVSVTNPLVAAQVSQRSDGKAIAITDPDVFVKTVTPLDRDTYRVGVGFDIVSTVKEVLGKGKPKQ